MKKLSGWTFEDIRGIPSSICEHRIFLEEDSKPSREHQRRLNPHMRDVLKKEILKWLEAGVIYAISDSQLVSPVLMVPKKSGLISYMSLNFIKCTRYESNLFFCQI